MIKDSNKDKAESTNLYAFSRVACSDISIRIILQLDKVEKAMSKEELLNKTMAGNEGIFEYTLGELIRHSLVTSNSPYSLTKLGKIITRDLKAVLP